MTFRNILDRITPLLTRQPRPDFLETKFAGQWTGYVDDGQTGSIRIELEERGSSFFGHAYVFYPPTVNVPGFSFQLVVPRTPPHQTQATTIYLYANGGWMSPVDRQAAEADLIKRFGELPIPNELQVSFDVRQPNLRIDWTSVDNRTGSIILTRSNIQAVSALKGRKDIRSWDEFRQWAVKQRPRNYIFRGQRYPSKLSSTFHRTWRTDLHSWVNNDVRQLFGALVEKVNYPLQLGNLEHNAAVWSILQHHGYPTPMIDWTFSPFVAAYFAFQEASLDQNDTPRIYIFDQNAWNERYGRQTFIVDAAPQQLVVLESLPIGNPRSGPQQALSTVTNIADVEEFVRQAEIRDGTCYLTVCDLPAAERPQIMRELELMGITYGSLFPGMDGVCRDMKDRLFRQPS